MFFNDVFRIPKQGKISEKTILARIVATITIVIVCLFAMCFSAYAYFTCNVTSGSNRIKTASFTTTVVIERANPTTKIIEFPPYISDHNDLKIEGLEVGEWYNVTITPSEENTAKTGFVVISADGCDLEYHTQQIGVDKKVKSEYTKELTFKIMITDATNLILKSCWGTSTFYQAERENSAQYITQNEKLNIIVNGYSEPNLNPESNETTNEVSTQKEDTATELPPDATPSKESGSTESTLSSAPSQITNSSDLNTSSSSNEEPELTDSSVTSASSDTEIEET